MLAVYSIPIPQPEFLHFNIGQGLAIGAASVGVIGAMATARYAPNFTAKVLSMGRTAGPPPALYRV